MIILNKEEAESVTKYYSELIIGKPITPNGESNPLEITSLVIKNIEDGYTVYCVADVSGRIAYSKLEKVIQDLDVSSLEEFLTSLY